MIRKERILLKRELIKYKKMTLKLPFPIPRSRLKSPQTKERTKKERFSSFPCAHNLPLRYSREGGGGGSCPERVRKYKQAGGHFFPHLEGGREWTADQGENSYHKGT